MLTMNARAWALSLNEGMDGHTSSFMQKTAKKTTMRALDELAKSSGAALEVVQATERLDDAVVHNEVSIKRRAWNGWDTYR